MIKRMLDTNAVRALVDGYSPAAIGRISASSPGGSALDRCLRRCLWSPSGSAGPEGAAAWADGPADRQPCPQRKLCPGQRRSYRLIRLLSLLIRRKALRLDPVRLPLIGTAEIGVVALEHGVGLVVAVEHLAGDGIAEAVITQDHVPGHGAVRDQ